MKPFKVAALTPIVAMLLFAAVARSQPTDLQALHRSGQTFITWAEEPAAGERYHVYRFTQPITAATIGQAERLTERWGALGEGSSNFWSELRRRDDGGNPNPYTARYVIDSDGPKLEAGTGLFVWTAEREGEYYYAITSVRAGSEDRQQFSVENSVGPVREQVTDPVPVASYRTPVADSRGTVYTQYLDYDDYNPTFGMERGSSNQQYAFNYAVSRPERECDGRDSYPLLVALHSWGGSYSFDNSDWPEREVRNDATPWGWCAVRLAPDDSWFTWYFGHSSSYDFRRGGTPDSGPIANYTEERILRAIYDTARDPSYLIDPNRIYIYGHSMGGSGTLSLALRYPNVFAAAYASEPMTNYRTADYAQQPCLNEMGRPTNWVDDVSAKWGWPVSNLPVRIYAPNRWADHLASYGQGGANSIGIWDWQNHQEQLVSRRATDTSLVALAHGSDDGVICWPTQGRPAYSSFYQGKHAFSAGVAAGTGHTWLSWYGLSPNLRDPTGSLVPFYMFQFKRNETVPALSAASDMANLPPPLAPQQSIGYNLGLEWSSSATVEFAGQSFGAWDGAPVDRSDLWRMSVRTTDGSTQSVDVTPRRLQQFNVWPGMRYSWEVRSVSDDSLIASGTTVAGDDCLVTVPAVTVTPQGGRISLTPQGNRPEDEACRNNPLQGPLPPPDGGGGGGDNKNEGPKGGTEQPPVEPPPVEPPPVDSPPESIVRHTLRVDLRSGKGRKLLRRGKLLIRLSGKPLSTVLLSVAKGKSVVVHRNVKLPASGSMTTTVGLGKSIQRWLARGKKRKLRIKASFSDGASKERTVGIRQ